MRHFDEQLDRTVQAGGDDGLHRRVDDPNGDARLLERNESLAAEVYAKEEQVNALQVEVDEKGVQLTALQQPVASDVRFLFMASRIGGELERIADQTINICQNTHYVLSGPADQAAGGSADHGAGGAEDGRARA